MFIILELTRTSHLPPPSSAGCQWAPESKWFVPDAASNRARVAAEDLTPRDCDVHGWECVPNPPPSASTPIPPNLADSSANFNEDNIRSAD